MLWSIFQEWCSRFTLCCVLLWLDIMRFYAYISLLLHWHWGNLTMTQASVTQPLMVWVYGLRKLKMKPQQNQSKQTVCLFQLMYNILGSDEWEVIDSIHKLSGTSGNFSTLASHPWSRVGDTWLYIWIVAVQIGHKVALEWLWTSTNVSYVKVWSLYSIIIILTVAYCQYCNALFS